MNAFEDLFKHIEQVACRYFNDGKENEEEANKIRTTLDYQISMLPLYVQAELVETLSNQVSFRNYEEHGYAIIRDIYCEHLLEDMISTAKIKLSNIKSGTYSPKSIDEKIESQLVELKNDQFESFIGAVERYQTPLKMDKEAKARDEFAWKEVNQLMQKVALNKKNGVYNEPEL